MADGEWMNCGWENEDGKLWRRKIDVIRNKNKEKEGKNDLAKSNKWREGQGKGLPMISGIKVLFVSILFRYL